MKRGFWLYLILAATLIYSSGNFAQEAANGFYGGLQFHASALTSFKNLGTYRPTFFDYTGDEVSPYGPILYQQAKLKNQYGGGGGASFGFRYNCFRAEAEFLYNVNKATELSYPATATSTATNFRSNEKTATSMNQTFLNGQTNEIFGFFNLFYDFLPDAKAETSVYPYVGVGIGYQKMQTVTKFKAKNWTVQQTSSTEKIENIIVSGVPGYDYTPCPDGTTTCVEGGISTTSRYLYANNVVGQGIVGFGFELDSYFNFFIDGRYIFSRTLPEYSNNNKLQLYTINFGLNYSFANVGGLGSL